MDNLTSDQKTAILTPFKLLASNILLKNDISQAESLIIANVEALATYFSYTESQIKSYGEIEWLDMCEYLIKDTNKLIKLPNLQ